MIDRRVGRWLDRVNLTLYSVAAFLVIFAVLFSQLDLSKTPRKPVVVRRIYTTTIIERVLGSSHRDRQTRSVSSAQSPSTAVIPLSSRAS